MSYNWLTPMKYQIVSLEICHVPFISTVFEENRDVLHCGQISTEEWQKYLISEKDETEESFIVTVDGNNAAWLKLNGLDTEKLYVSMLVVAKEYQGCGVGTFAVCFAEKFAQDLSKESVVICTTTDNFAAINLYKKLGYLIQSEIRYATGDEVVRDGYEFVKNLEGNGEY